MPAYLGGLLISLAAMLGIFQMKRAMMPKFHPVEQKEAAVTLAPGGGVRLNYGAEPGYFLIPGMPTRVLASVRRPDGTLAPLRRWGYGELVEKRVLIGPLAEESAYEVRGEFYICAQPGVEHCSKLEISQDVTVSPRATEKFADWNIDLTALGQRGLSAGEEANTKVNH